MGGVMLPPDFLEVHGPPYLLQSDLEHLFPAGETKCLPSKFCQVKRCPSQTWPLPDFIIVEGRTEPVSSCLALSRPLVKAQHQGPCTLEWQAAWSSVVVCMLALFHACSCRGWWGN